jgi:hypothetical protein
MQQMTFMECVKGAWASAWDAVTRMPGLMLGTFAIFAVLGWLGLAGRPVPGEGDVPSVGLIVAADAASMLNIAVYLWFTVKIYRFVLLGERTTPLLAGSVKPLIRMLGLSLLLVLGLVAAMAVCWLVLRPKHAGGIAFLSVVVSTIWLIVCVRLSLLSASLAIGGRIALGAAWRDSRGHVWSLLSVSGVATLPVLVCGIIILLGLGVAGVTPETVQTPGWFAALAILQSIGNIAFVLLTTTSFAWLYRRYANELGAPDTRGVS